MSGGRPDTTRHVSPSSEHQRKVVCAGELVVVAPDERHDDRHLAGARGHHLGPARPCATAATPSLVLLDPVPVQNAACISAPGDLMASEFNPDGTLNVVWTRNTDPTTCGTVTVRDIYFARSR